MKNGIMKMMSLLLVVIFLLNAVGMLSISAETVSSTENTGTTVSAEDTFDTLSFKEYAALHEESKVEDVTIDVDVTAYSSADNVENNADGTIRTQGSGYVTWTIEIPKTGWYAVAVTYTPVASSGGNFAGYIERTVRVDGAVPYSEAKYVQFKRAYQDNRNVYEFEKDELGNDMSWAQSELTMEQERILTDASGYVPGYLTFYLEAGAHTLGLHSEQGAMDIRALRLFTSDPVPTYAEYQAQYTDKADNATGSVELRAELPDLRSDYTLLPLSDSTTPATQPNDVMTTKLNTIGGEKWATVGQWMSWKFDVPTDGWYTIGLRYRQNVYPGTYSSRCIYIDDVVPFQEAKTVMFKYDDSWQNGFLGNNDGDFRFYLTAGTHSLKMEVVLGSMAEILESVSDIMKALNQDYLSILVYTGTRPDEYRDYEFEKLIPQVLEDFKTQHARLSAVCDSLQELSKSRGQITNTLEQTLMTLETINEDAESIAKEFSYLKDNISALGTWITTYCQQPLEIDTVYVCPEGTELLRANGSFVENLWFQVRAFFASFTRDYAYAGGEDTDISVWFASGSEQAAIVRRMTREMFTADTGISVDLQLVAGGSLLSAVLAGISPDVCLGVGSAEPIDFALRSAVEDLSQFEDFNEVTSRFHETALIPFQFNGATYALPESQSFPMMFYRKDVLHDLGVALPETWEDIYALIPVLQTNNMEFGLAWDSALSMFLYQNGGTFYTEDFSETALYTDTAMRAFQKTTDLYTEYGLLVSFDFANRFRDGSMPIAIVDFSVYNTLAIFAPEIKGMWGMAMVPGTVQEDGTVSKLVASNSSGVIMLSSVKEEDKAAAWEYIKWWTSSDAQIKYAVEMESILGASAKQAASNVEAFSQMSWPAELAAVISAQRKQTFALPNIPGGYFLGRTLDFAFNTVYSGTADSVTALEDNLPDLNAELKRKRKEFGLD